MRSIRFLICKIFLLVLGLSVLQTTAGQQAEGIHKAVTAGDLKKAQSRLEADSTLLECKNNVGYTPLMCACYPLWMGEIANFLLDKGANVNVSGALRFPPLHFASFVLEQNLNLIQCLIEKRPNLFRIG